MALMPATDADASEFARFLKIMLDTVPDLEGLGSILRTRDDLEGCSGMRAEYVVALMEECAQFIFRSAHFGNRVEGLQLQRRGPNSPKGHRCAQKPRKPI